MEPTRLIGCRATAPAGGFRIRSVRTLYLEGHQAWRNKIGVGVAIGIGIEGTRDGIRPFRTGYHNLLLRVLTQLGSEVESGS